jgi:glycosyltransferase involved in cell wall biosynthesis
VISKTGVRDRRRHPESAISVAIVGPDISGRAPGGMSAISTLLLREFESRADINLIPIANFEEGRWIRRLYTGLRAIFEIIRLRKRVDIVHIQVAVGLSIERDVLLALTARALRLPVISQFHGGQPADYANGSVLHRLLYRLLIRLSVRNLVLGSKTERWLRSVSPTAATAIIPNFVTPRRPVATSAIATPPVILYVGWLKVRKGILDLLSATEILSSETSEFRMWIAGDGELATEQEFLNRVDRLRDIVSLLGWKDPSDVVRLMNASTAVVLPSHTEGLPMVILEAMAAGRAVIATNVGEIEDAISDGDDGILVAPRDATSLAEAIRRIVRNPTLAAEMGRAGLARVETMFSADKVIQDLSQIYKSVVSERVARTGSLAS